MPLWKQDYPGGNGGLTWCKSVTGIGSLHHNPNDYLPTPNPDTLRSGNTRTMHTSVGRHGAVTSTTSWAPWFAWRTSICTTPAA
jgi:hypothetical protein